MKVKTVKSLLIIATVLSVGVSSVPVMAGNSDVGILFVYHSFTPKSPMPDSHRGL